MGFMQAQVEGRGPFGGVCAIGGAKCVSGEPCLMSNNGSDRGSIYEVEGVSRVDRFYGANSAPIKGCSTAACLSIIRKSRLLTGCWELVHTISRNGKGVQMVLFRLMEQRTRHLGSEEHSSGARQELEVKIAQVTQNKLLWE